MIKEITQHTDLPAGTPIVARATRGMEHYLTEGKTYIAINGLEDGIFPDRPFVSVIDDNGERIDTHASRFVLISE